MTFFLELTKKEIVSHKMKQKEYNLHTRSSHFFTHTLYASPKLAIIESTDSTKFNMFIEKLTEYVHMIHFRIQTLNSKLTIFKTTTKC